MILVFSGTGNSMYVAQSLSRILGERVVTYPAVVQANDNERIIWCFPVYSWGVPPVVIRWIDACRSALTASGDHYAVMTCGDDAGLTARQWRRLIGTKAHGAFTVIMPNIYVLMRGFDTDPAEVEDAKIAAAEQRIADIARAIETGFSGDDVTRGRFAFIKSKIIYPGFVSHAMSPKPFHPTEGCVGCGICSRTCPLHNISMKDHRPCWGDNCAQCLRCYHICPHHAVAYGKATRGKGRYTAMLHLVNGSECDTKTNKGGV